MTFQLGTQWWLWLENSVLAEAIRQWVWAYPFIEILHILSITLLVGSVVMFDLRLLGVSRHVTIAAMAEQLLPWAYASFGIVMLSGFLLFATDATAIALNPAFRLKLVLILGASINAITFHWKCYPLVRQWNLGIKPPKMVRAIAIISIILWIAVITCGSLIAYV